MAREVGGIPPHASMPEEMMGRMTSLTRGGSCIFIASPQSITVPCDRVGCTAVTAHGRQQGQTDLQQ